MTADFGVISVAEPYDRLCLIYTMAEFYRTLGCSNFMARLPRDYAAPPVIEGTLAPHRPDLYCVGGDRRQTPIFLEAVLPGDVEQEPFWERWQLLDSAARNYRSELHFVTPQWPDHAPVLRRHLDLLGVRPNAIWTP